MERVWSLMKRYTRKYNDGGVETLKKKMLEGLSPSNVSISSVRKFIRLTFIYLAAYDNKLSMSDADSITRTYRSKRAADANLLTTSQTDAKKREAKVTLAHNCDKKYKSHRGYSKRLDDSLSAIYNPSAERLTIIVSDDDNMDNEEQAEDDDDDDEDENDNQYDDEEGEDEEVQFIRMALLEVAFEQEKLGLNDH